MTKLVVIFGFLMAFVAGLIVGVNRPQRVVSNPGAPDAPSSTRPSRGDRERGELRALLNLRPDQEEAMRKIWAETAERGRKEIEKRRDDLRCARDEKIDALFSSEQKASIKQIHDEYDQQRKALEQEMRANFHTAVEATKSILDDGQRGKYEQWLERRNWGRGPRGGGGDRGPGGPGGDRGPGGPGGPATPQHDRETTGKSDAGATSKPSDPS